MTYAQAAAKLPETARWTASFGNPGNGGYAEYHRDISGHRYVIANGDWYKSGDVWTFQLVEERT